MGITSMLAGQLGMGVVLQAKNEMSRPANEAERDLKRLQGTAVSTGTSLRTNMAGAGVAMMGVARNLSLVGVAVGAVVATMAPFIKAAAESEFRLANVKTLLVGTGMSAAEADIQIKGLDNSISLLAGRTIQSAEDMETASYKLVSVLGMEQGRAALETTAKLATAGIGTMQDAAEVETVILANFGKAWGDSLQPMEKARRAAGGIAAVVARNNTTLPLMGQAIKQSAGQAIMAGARYEEYIAILGRLQSKGMEASQAGTTLSAMYRGIYRLATPEGKKVMPWLDTKDASGKMLPWLNILEQIQKHYGITDAQTAKLAKNMNDLGLNGKAAFEGTGIAVKTASKLVEAFQEQGSTGIGLLISALGELRADIQATSDSQGKLDEMAKAREETGIGQWRMLKGSIGAITKQMGESGATVSTLKAFNRELSGLNAMMVSEGPWKGLANFIGLAGLSRFGVGGIGSSMGAMYGNAISSSTFIGPPVPLPPPNISVPNPGNQAGVSDVTATPGNYPVSQDTYHIEFNMKDVTDPNAFVRTFIKGLEEEKIRKRDGRA